MIVVAAAVLRLWQIDTGIPYALGSDEPAVIDSVVGMLKTGRMHPPFFDYPGLIFYLHFPVACLRFMYGAVAGEWASLAEAHNADFYLWSRVTTALLGIATVVLTHRAGMRWGPYQALSAAALLAVMPMHVRESRFALTDVPMTFLVALTFVLSLRAHEQTRILGFALAGMTAGFATAIKYTAGIAVALPVTAAAAARLPWRARATAVLVTAFSFGVGFVMGAPFVIIDLPGFLDGFANLTASYRVRPGEAEYGGWIYLKHLRINLSTSAYVLMLAGLMIAMGRAVAGPERVKWVMLAGFPLAFWYSIADRSLIYGRYLLPMLPFTCLLTAVAISWPYGVAVRYASVRIARLGTAVVSGLAIIPTALMSVGYLRATAPDSTQTAAYEWIRSNVPPGSALVIESTALRFPADLYPTAFVTRFSDKPASEYRATGARYIVVMADRLGSSMEGGTSAASASEYREVARFTSSADRLGPNLIILELR